MCSYSLVISLRGRLHCQWWSQPFLHWIEIAYTCTYDSKEITHERTGRNLKDNSWVTQSEFSTPSNRLSSMLSITKKLLALSQVIRGFAKSTTEIVRVAHF